MLHLLSISLGSPCVDIQASGDAAPGKPAPSSPHVLPSPSPRLLLANPLPSPGLQILSLG